MNEQLIVKNFGPIKDATVDFKKVTVFIGPTGGGKSTLAKLITIYRESFFNFENKKNIQEIFKKYSLNNYFKTESNLSITTASGRRKSISKNLLITIEDKYDKAHHDLSLIYDPNKTKSIIESLHRITPENFRSMIEKAYKSLNSEHVTTYIPAERVFSSSIEYSWPGLLRDDIGLPKTLLDFSNIFFNARKLIQTLNINFFKVKYIHRDGHDYIKIAKNKKLFRLFEVASGMQSVIPLMVSIEYITNQIDQINTFVLEEPELNLYPTAQQGLLNWLVEKCTADENDLTITTHSPYILSHLNLLLYAYQVAEKHPERADDVAKIVPRESWINPKEFAAYHVEGQKEGGVHSIVNPETGLISYNDLDALAGNSATEFDQLLDINAGLEVE